MSKKRIFVPSRPDKTYVKRWIWTESRLICEYKDGLKTKSGWTLRELLNADHTKGDGLPAIEVF